MFPNKTYRAGQLCQLSATGLSDAVVALCHPVPERGLTRRFDAPLLLVLQLFERRALGIEALVAAAALPLEELLALAAGADPSPACPLNPSPTPSPRAGEEAPLAGATPDPALAEAPDPAAESAHMAAPAAPWVAAEACEGVAEAAAIAAHAQASSAPALDPAPAAARRTLLLPLAGAAGAAGGSQIWRGARLRVCIGYSAVRLPSGGGSDALGAVRGEAAGGEGLWAGFGTCSDSPAPWLEDGCASSSYGASGSEAGWSTLPLVYMQSLDAGK